ncbi:MAG TPA: carbohydrate-binding family 9-like protein [Bryobacteraceae bacterium]|nr:carbohydrate-binding family 9-like protein [Bryobacteraceae bacterium]
MRPLLFLLSAAALWAQSPPEYRIQRATSKIIIDGKIEEPAWQTAPAMTPFVFNWFTSGDKEPTEAKLLWDDDNLYVYWRASDRHISAYELKRHGPVSRDDCIEIFISPNPAKIKNYYTFEINAIGTMLNRARTDWWTGPPTWEPEGVQYRTTFQGMPKKDESPDDREWIVEMSIPLKNFARDAAHTPPIDGDEWRLNLQRLGGKTNPQSSTWSPIPAPARSFHTPEAFGKVIFAAQAAPESRQRRGGRNAFGPRREPPPDAAAAAAGKEIYNRSCTMCHGINGAEGDRAPALAAQRRYLRQTREELFDAIKNGIKGTLMPASPMPEADVRKTVEYIRSLRATAIDVPVTGDVQRGEALFHGKAGCAQCHMVNGRGGLIGPDLSTIGGERKMEDLRNALTQAKPIPPRGYQPVTWKAPDGRTLRGVVKNENNFSLQILGVDQKLHLLLREEIKDLKYEEKSLMPTDVHKKLSRSEFEDLVAFLSRQSGRRTR